MNTHTIDATNKSLGRIATEIAILLMGKNLPSYRRHIAPQVEVRVSNIDRLSILPKKLKNETHMRYSGYPGGQKIESWSSVVERHGHGELLRHAVYGMLPKNRLRQRMIKNLIVEK